MTRVVAFIVHGRPGRGSGPLTEAFGAIRRRHADVLAERFRLAGADEIRIVDAAHDDRPFGARLREAIGSSAGSDGVVVLGSGSVPLARIADLRPFVVAAGGRPAGPSPTMPTRPISSRSPARSRLTNLPDLTTDNILPRWLAEHAGFAVDDVRRRWRLQVDLDSPLDVLLVGFDDLDGIETAPARSALARARPRSARDPSSRARSRWPGIGERARVAREGRG